MRQPDHAPFRDDLSSSDSEMLKPAISIILIECLLLSPAGVRSIAISPSVCLYGYLRNHVMDLHQFLCMSSVALARSSAGGIAIRYVLPVLWMTSYLPIIGRIAYFNTGAKCDVHECLAIFKLCYAKFTDITK